MAKTEIKVGDRVKGTINNLRGEVIELIDKLDWKYRVQSDNEEHPIWMCRENEIELDIDFSGRGLLLEWLSKR